MATETTYNIVKVEELRVISTAAGNDHIIINDVDSVPLETKKITVENFAYAIKDYVLPIASAEILGGIRVGQGLTINPATGVLSNDIYALNDLNDVQVVNPVANQVLVYDGTKWTNNDNESVLGINAGDGLSGGGSGKTVTLNVNAGQGIQIREDAVCTNNGQGLTYSGGRNQVDIGSGLTFFGNQVSVNAGQGIIINDTGVSVNPGRGLHFVGNTVAVDIGSGLIFADNVVEVNLTLQDLKNVELTTPSNGDVLSYKDGKWVNTEVPFAVTGFLGNGSMTIEVKDDEYYYCAGGSDLKIRVEAEPVNENGDPIIGIFEFDWQSSDDNVNWTTYTRSREKDITYIRENHMGFPNYHGSPKHFRVVVGFTDLYGNEASATSPTVTPELGTVSRITSHPVEVDMSEDVTTGSFTVNVTTNEPNPEITYLWYVNGVNINAADSGNMGYTFSNWDTNTLNVTRTDDEAYSYAVQCFVSTNSFCGGLLRSYKVWLHGPSGCCGGDPPREPIIDRYLVTCYPGPISAYASMVGSCSGFIKGGTHAATPPGYTVHGRLLALSGVTQGPGYSGQYWPSGYCSSFYVTMDVNDVECNP